MPLSKTEPPPQPPPSLLPTKHFYSPLPPCQHDQQAYVVLPFYHQPTNPHRRWPIITASFLFTISALAYVFWPSDPTLTIVGMRLNKIHIHTMPIINVDISLYLTVKVRNVDVYSIDFRSLYVAVKYRGKMLCHVRSNQGHVRALSSSYVDAEMDFDGVSILSDIVALLDDLARGTVPFDTDTEVTGMLGLFFFRFPLKAKLSCEVLVNTINQTIVGQNCYPKMNLKALSNMQQKLNDSERQETS